MATYNSTEHSYPQKSPHVVVIGEAVMDIVQSDDRAPVEKPGGSPANVALALGRLGRTPRLVTQLGDDYRGEAIRSWLEESHVEVCATTGQRTSTATASIDAHGTASYEFDITWDIEPQQHPVDILHVGSIAAALDPGCFAASELVDRHRAHSLITFDPNIRSQVLTDPVLARRRVLSFIERSEVVKASDEDVEWLCPGGNVVDIAQEWASRGQSLVVITRGSNGSIAVTASTIVAVEAVVVDIVDTVGAGDTFMGALIDGLIQRGIHLDKVRNSIDSLATDDLHALLTQAAQAAAINVSRPGTDPPTRNELDVLQRKSSPQTASTSDK